jgi:predicted ATPase/DNA-binding SARP family transcriptional activator
MALEIRILGSLEVLRDNVPVRLEGRLRRSLVAVFALHAGETLSQDRLIDALWPEYDPGARARLHVYISQLRRTLGPEASALETRPGGYALAVEAEAVDAFRFEHLAAVGRAALAADEAERAASAFTDALSLWRGSALEEFVYESFAGEEAGRLEELRLAVLEDRVEAQLALGRHAEIVTELERLVAASPLRERLRGQLMLALYRCGRQADALGIYRETRRLLDEELGLEPGPELKGLQHAILSQDATLRVEAPELRARRHLPAPPNPLVGRREEIDTIGALVRSEGVRFLTLTGVGGAGKTRLALQAAHELADAFQDGVFFVDLSHLDDPSLVPSQIAHTLGADEHGDQPLSQTLAQHLRKRRLLLLLDNFEVVDEAAPLLSKLVTAAPDLALLVTSRTPLRLNAEHEYRVAPLSPTDAARLFAVRARAVAPASRRASEESAEVIEICRRLDHLPLGIELAAARTRDLAPAEMLEQLPRMLDLASGDARDLPERQQTLRATIDWSYALLDAAEQRLFAQLAVFAGEFGVAAADAVCGAGRDALGALVGWNLVRERPGTDGDARFLLLETLREYALERLRATSDEPALRRRHARHMLELAEEFERSMLAGAELVPWLDRLSSVIDDFRAALGWCREAGDSGWLLRLAGALGRFWAVRSPREGRAWLETALEGGADQPGDLRAKALAAACKLSLGLGDYSRLTILAEENVALCATLDDRDGLARALDRLATALSNTGRLEKGLAVYEQSAAIFRELDDRRGLAVSLTNLGCLALMMGDLERGGSLCEQGRALHAELGQRDAMLQALFNVGLAALLLDRPHEARTRFREGLEIACELDYAESLIYFLEGFAGALAASGEPDQAAMLLGAAHVAEEATGIVLEPLERDVHERTVGMIRDVLDEATFTAAWAAGERLPVRDAATYALGLGLADLQGRGDGDLSQAVGEARGAGSSP